MVTSFSKLCEVVRGETLFLGNSRLAIIVSLLESVSEHKRRAARRPEFVNLEKDVWSSCRLESVSLTGFIGPLLVREAR